MQNQKIDNKQLNQSLKYVGYLITYPNLEKFSEIELKKYLSKYRILNIKNELSSNSIYNQKSEGIIIFYFEKLEDLETLAYYSQSAKYVGLLLSIIDTQIKNKKQTEMIDNLFHKQIQLLKQRNLKTFKVNIKHSKNYALNEEEYTNTINKIVKKLKEQEFKSDLDNYDFELLTYLSKLNSEIKRTLLGINIIAKDLSKRSYKIYMLPKSIKGTLAFLINSISGILEPTENNTTTKNANSTITNKILFMFTGDGMLPIELALWLNDISPRYYDKRELNQKFVDLTNNYKTLDELEKYFNNKITNIKNKSKIQYQIYSIDSELKNITFAERNAKLAGVEKSIIFSKITTDMLDYKFEENEFSTIISFPPLFNTTYKPQKIKKFFNELFYQTSYILKPKGIKTMLSKKENYEIIKEIAEKNKFVIERLNFGRNDLEILKFKNIK